MNKKMLSVLAAVSLLVAITFMPVASFAEKGGNGGGHGNNHKSDFSVNSRSLHRNPDFRRDLISKEEEDIIRTFLREENASFCPPGLAKKDNGCLPPGQAKKYSIGAQLDKDVTWKDIPERLLKLLSPAKQGQKYVQVDEDVLLIAEGTQLVLDAIGLMDEEQ